MTRKMWVALVLEVGLIVGMAAYVAVSASPAKAPAARTDYTSENARLAVSAWAGAVETGDVGLACQASSGLLSHCKDYTRQIANASAGTGVFRVGPAHKLGRGFFTVDVIFQTQSGAQKLSVLVHEERGGFRYVGAKAA